MNKSKKDNYKIPVYSWCPEIEENAQLQIDNLAMLPFAYRQIAIMSDCHTGYGMPIGGVLATEDVVIPNAVGVDIGCGVIFQETNIPIKVLQKETGTVGKIINGIIGNIKRNIPVGFSKHREPQRCHAVENCPDVLGGSLGPSEAADILENATYQVGTLGGGNHFIELQADTEDHLCIMIHSGSRNMGKKICDFYNKAAKELNELWWSSVDSSYQLSFLPMNSEIGKDYCRWMNLSLCFAQENRDRMMQACMSVILNMVKKYDGFAGIELKDQINIHHNYACK